MRGETRDGTPDGPGAFWRFSHFPGARETPADTSPFGYPPPGKFRKGQKFAAVFKVLALFSEWKGVKGESEIGVLTLLL
jgi:hypothetical protein